MWIDSTHKMFFHQSYLYGTIIQNQLHAPWNRPWGRGERVEIFRQADLYINREHIIQGFRKSMLPSLFPSMSPWIRAINAPCSFLIKLSDWRHMTKNAGGHFFHWLSFCDFAMIFSKEQGNFGINQKPIFQGFRWYKLRSKVSSIMQERRSDRPLWYFFDQYAPLTPSISHAEGPCFHCISFLA